MDEDKEKIKTKFFEGTTNMRNYWYPIAPSNEVLDTMPCGHYILGDPIVIYRDPNTKKPVALEDKCAHRSVKLSDGRIREGRIECLYHGWQYDSTGACKKIPTLPHGQAVYSACKIRKYNTVEVGNWVWIWPGTTEPTYQPSFYTAFEGNDITPKINYVDVDVDHCLLVENFLDPSHIPFTHEKTIGRTIKPMPLSVTCEFNENFLSGETKWIENQERKSIGFKFIPPATVSIASIIIQNITKFEQFFWAVPTEKGKSRFIAHQKAWFFNIFDNIPGLSSLMNWYIRTANRKILMEDYKMLKGQQEMLSYGANAMAFPVSADLLCKTYRQWWRLAMKQNPWFNGYLGDIEDIILPISETKK